jgi:predicted ATP-binding protein involved in virulence
VSGTNQSMRIKQLRLKNYRGIKDLQLNFDSTQKIVILVGVNGVGKSSLLDCISFLIKSYGLIANDDSLQSIFQDRDIRIGSQNTRNGLSGVFDDLETSWNIERARGDAEAVNTPANSVESIKYINSRYDLDSFVLVYYSASRRATQIQENLDILNSNISVSGNQNNISIDGHSKIHNLFINTTDSNFSNSNSSLDSSNIIDFRGFTYWFQKLEDFENEIRLSIDNNHRDIKLESTRKAIYSMLGDGFSNLRMKRAIDKLTIHKANQEIELDWLSDGERGLLALAGDLARRLAMTYPDSVNPLHEAGLVLIDEIELHLHPEWQRIIIQRLTQTFPGCQFIVTTHSPQVLSNVQPECIHILAIEDDNVVVKRPERSYGRDSNRILEDIMGVSKRPPEIEARILELFRIIHDGELDRAKDLIQNLATEIGIDEPELIRAASTIHRREVIGR